MARRFRPQGNEDDQRRRPGRRARRRVLIVSEGRTELAYLSALIDRLGINARLIDMREGDPHHPEGVLRSAEQRLKASFPDEYGRAFCVFDQDQHESFQPTVQKIRAGSGPLGIVRAIPSVPCFEYWLLLHFEKTARLYPATEGVSSCREVERDLKRRMPGYSKGMEGARTWRRILSGLKDARKNSREILRQAESDPDGNSPYTHMHELVDYLETLKEDN